MKKWTMSVLLVGLVVLSLSSISYAFSFDPITDFNDWNEVEQIGQFQFSGATATVSTNNESNLWHGHDNAIGLLSTINISSVTAPASAGIGMYLGRIGADRVHCNITVYQSESTQVIYYHIRLRNENDELYKSLAWGRFGGTNEPIVGQNVTVAFARMSNEILFYVQGYHIIKWSPLEQMSEGDSGMWLWAWANQESGGEITATFSNVTVICP